MKRAFLIVPPTDLWVREDRCQGPIRQNLVKVIRPPIRLGQAGAILESAGYECEVADYPAEEKTWGDFKADLEIFNPDILFISTAFKTRNDDFQACALAKAHNPEILTIMKGAPLGDDLEALEQCPELDIFMTRDIDGKFLSIVKGENLTEIHGINFWLDGRIVITPKAEFTNDLDNLPFLARHLFKNDLYKRPDTGQPVTVITAAKGCPEECIFCSAPLGTGKTLRQRAPQSIVDEIRDCVQKYGIRNFLLAAETFTYNRKWAMEICDRIIERQLKVTWTCSTRVDRMDEELARRMKQSGCYSIALGIESGNQQTLDLMKKKATLEQAEKAIPIIHQAGIKTYQTYVIGFPWETREMIEQTIDFAIKLDGDITQFILALPLYGTELYEVTKKSDQLVKSGSFLHDYRIKNQYLSDEELDQLYRKAMRKFYLRPRYIFKTIKSLSSPAVLLRTATLGFGSLFQHLRSNPQGRLN